MTWLLREPTGGEPYYRGHGSGEPGGGRLVTVEQDGQVLGLLRHVVRHSPTGMTWGYAGSGPADLALSLLVDALGEDARCGTCRGHGQVWQRFTADGEQLEPVDPASGDDSCELLSCPDCEQGLALLPYQDLKFAVVAGLPEHGWVLPRSQVLAWYYAALERG